MSQYHPVYKASEHADLNRRITKKEYEAVISAVEELGFANGWIQGYLTDHERFLGTKLKPAR